MSPVGGVRSMMLLRLELSLGLTGTLSVGALPGRAAPVFGWSDDDGSSCGPSCCVVFAGSSERGGACAQTIMEKQRSKQDKRISSILVQHGSLDTAALYC